jgi:hypothetical protein
LPVPVRPTTVRSMIYFVCSPALWLCARGLLGAGRVLLVLGGRGCGWGRAGRGAAVPVPLCAPRPRPLQPAAPPRLGRARLWPSVNRGWHAVWPHAGPLLNSSRSCSMPRARPSCHSQTDLRLRPSRTRPWPRTCAAAWSENWKALAHRARRQRGEPRHGLVLYVVLLVEVHIHAAVLVVFRTEEPMYGALTRVVQPPRCWQREAGASQ